MGIYRRYNTGRKNKSTEKDSENIGALKERLALARNAAGKTQEEAARYIGLSGRSMISRFENGTRIPSLEALRKLAEYYRVDPTRLVPEAEHQNFFLSIAAAPENSEAETDLNVLPANTIPVKVSDDNMAPLLLRGDIIWIDPLLPPVFQSGLACVIFDGSVKACWLTKNADGFIGLQVHPDYCTKPFVIAPENVFGAVVELHRHFFHN